MDPQWDDMRVFLAVARESSLSGAGRILKMDPATVGRRISRFEEALDTPLFVKSPQGYALSAAGDRLLGHAEAAEQAMRAGQEALVGPSDTLSGQIRIGAPDGSANYLLPQVCAKIGAENPDLDIQIVALPRVINLSRREADMAVTVSAPTAGQLLVQKITDYKLHLVGSRHYLREHPPINTLEDLKDHKMIGYIPDMIFDRELDYLNNLGIERVALASNSVSVQIKLAAEGTALCVAHDFTLPSHRSLRKVLTDKISLSRSFYLVRHQGDQRSDRLNRFAQALSKGIRDEVVRLEGLT
ncbi:LysR family transcriptional regulator [Phaeobacter gallaeciensis]|uniref:Transcriptional regulator, LysR family n=1 Tax=Phaeobacter gallaeciensis TaxID=60890 RepID=A0AAC9Z8N7_9RHOB|nr:LysR family transcriptional regulator [Phaeobacter gallaeciensis]AHD09356.1 Transcriptional regulator [Phaeobacter gallaeciensis DSM 26640]ATE92619.1 transcriptional regulator, LysR family [Phaeobacter gallaeciensis]ATE97559.1 transcriptional regulator, LysR family [Phaeobacter gallaeciensis]ATF01284.1 transcriptional regulator, LysR family [Phaeobacter gallaeciensis]ATF05664.1 transcriptional regulator, LysR family [Phaeobacter gallaeciensis]